MQFTVQKKGYRPVITLLVAAVVELEFCVHRHPAVMGRELLSTKVHVTSLHRCFEIQTGQRL